MKKPRPLRTRIVAVLVCLFAALAFIATVLPMRSIRQNYEILHRGGRLFAAQIVLMYLERNFEGEWRAEGGNLHKGLFELADASLFSDSLSSYLPRDLVIGFHVGGPPIPEARLPARNGATNEYPPPAVGERLPNQDTRRSGEAWRPAVPFLTDGGAGIVVRDAQSRDVGWISVESGENWKNLRGNRRNVSLILLLVAMNLGAILFFGAVVLWLTTPVDAIAEAHERTKARNLELSNLSMTDPLTRLLNRRGVEAELARQGGPDAVPSCVAIIDIDHFKAVNDERGHEEGDRVLAAVAETVSSSVRSGDVCGRWGGEEFIVLFRDLRDAHFSAERIRATLEARRFGLPESPLAVTVTIGIAAIGGDGFAAALADADAAMYRGKREGRNRVVAAQPDYAVRNPG
jgi:diguanylate cyclase (GGDEF)-like protein